MIGVISLNSCMLTGAQENPLPASDTMTPSRCRPMSASRSGVRLMFSSLAS